MKLPPPRDVARWLWTWRQIILLGILTCGAYGLVLYGFGIIAGPIQEDEGWSSAAVNAAFMGSYLLGAAASLVSGRVLDALGPRPVLWTGLIVGTIFLMAASYSENIWLFIVFWTIGGRGDDRRPLLQRDDADRGAALSPTADGGDDGTGDHRGIFLGDLHAADRAVHGRIRLALGGAHSGWSWRRRFRCRQCSRSVGFRRFRLRSRPHRPAPARAGISMASAAWEMHCDRAKCR